MAEPTPESRPQGAAEIAGNAVGDQPTSEDSLGFAPYVEAIAAFLTSPATQPPLTMSIEGDWGSGKSSFMLQLEQAIRGPSKNDVFIQKLPRSMGGLGDKSSLWQAAWLALRQRPQITIKFNAWRHDKQDALWAAFALKFAKSLRKQIGVLRAWKGDVSLFRRRLSGLRGWLELLLLFASVLLLAVGAAGLYRYVKAHNGTELTQVIANLTAAESMKPPAGPDADSEVDRPYRFLLLHGKWGALIALSLAGLIRFHKQIKLPLSINLEKYLSKPDYEGRVAFIEAFHEDFARLVDAYAKDRRIFVFIDDLDRCDVPRAAELMQAINLMIGDAGKLVFILGMDREKVAAGIAQKYKGLLPFIPEFASSAPGQENQLGALYFGYSYLEKFIQISFTLPVMSSQAALRHFLSGIASQRTPSTWLRRVATYWSPRLKPVVAIWRALVKRQDYKPDARAEAHIPEAGVASTAANAVAQEKRVTYLRVKVKEDSDRILDIVSMVSGIFENNPRKLKQFINTFRLALFLGSEQGLLDQEEGSNPVTPEQLGKFVAITLRFPDLRPRLSETPSLLANLESGAQSYGKDAFSFSASSVAPGLHRWLGQRGVRDVLLYGLEPNRQPSELEAYSLKAFPVARLLSILPKVPEKTPEKRASPHVDTPSPASGGSADINTVRGDLKAVGSATDTVRFPDIARSSPQPRSSGIQSGLGDDNGKSRKESDVRRSTIEEDEPNSNVPRNPQRLIASAEETLAIARKSGNRRDESNALGNLGIASHSLGEYRKAFEYYEQALAIDREIGDRRGEGTALWNMSSVLDKLGDRKKAIEYAEAALKIFEEIEDPRAANVRKQLDLWKTG